MANQQARHDENRVPAITGHSSITDPSETRRILVDTNGRLTTSIPDSTNGGGQIKVVQEGLIDESNSTSTPLGIDAVFTGEAVDITDYALILLSIYSDQDSATNGLCIDKSHDGTNWYCSDEFTISANTFKTFSFQTDALYYRIRYTNGGVAQTTFTMQSKLMKTYSKPSSHRIVDSISDQDDAELVKAVLTGENPAGSFVNFQSTTAGNFKVSLEELENAISTNNNTQLRTTIYSESGNDVGVDVLGGMKVYEPTILVGSSFVGTTVDPNFWTVANANNGTTTQNGELILETNTTADGSTQVTSVRRARKIPGTVNQFRGVGHFVTDPQANNIRTFGIYDDNNGMFFKLDGTTFKIVTRSSGVDTEVSSGSFNGDMTSYTADTDIHRWAIDYSAVSVKFWVDDLLIHTVSSTSEPYTRSLNLPIRLTNVNSGGNTTDNQLHFQLLTILRFGRLQTEAISKYQAGTTAGIVLKYGAGELKRAVISGVVNNSVITLYDNTAASGTILWSSGTMGAQTQPFSLDFGDLPFGIGLTLVISGANSNITVVYE